MINFLKKPYLYRIGWSILLLWALPDSLLWAESSDAQKLPAVPEVNDTPPTSVLPQLPPLTLPSGNLSTLEKVRVKKFDFDGNQVISDADLADLTKEYEGREITAEELQEVKNKITSYYLKKGYINSGAIIPDQSVKGGIITLKIIEGKLVKIDISGNKKVRTRYIEKRLGDKETEVLNLETLQTRLQLIQQNKLFKRIGAELGPGINPGEGILKLEVEEASPYQATFTFNNHRAPSIGANRGEIKVQHRNLTGWGDSLLARYGIAEGLDDYQFEYSFPLTAQDTTLTLSAERSKSKVIEDPFDQLNIKSDADTYSISLRHPFRWGIERELGVGIRFEKRQSTTYLIDAPFSFSPGVGDDGETNISVIRVFQDWLNRSRNQVVAARSSFSFGVDVLDATRNDDGTPDSRFFTWLGQFQWVRRLDFELFKNIERLNNSQILWRADLQWANEDLLPLEKLSIGGATTVRGYRENQLTRDNGFVTSLEWRIPLVKLRIPKLSRTEDDGQVYVTPFIDYGRSWNADSDTPDPKNIYSTGLGLQWKPSHKLDAALYWGTALQDIPEPEDENLQDKGIHFEIVVDFF